MLAFWRYNRCYSVRRSRSMGSSGETKGFIFLPRIQFVLTVLFSLSWSANPVWSISAPSAKVKKTRTLSRVEHVTSATLKYSVPCKRFAAAIFGTQSREPLESLGPQLIRYNQKISTKMCNIFPSLVLCRTVYAINEIYTSLPCSNEWLWQNANWHKLGRKKKFLLSICDSWKVQMFEIQIFSDEYVKLIIWDSMTWVISIKDWKEFRILNWIENFKIMWTYFLNYEVVFLELDCC